MLIRFNLKDYWPNAVYTGVKGYIVTNRTIRIWISTWRWKLWPLVFNHPVFSQVSVQSQTRERLAELLMIQLAEAYKRPQDSVSSQEYLLCVIHWVDIKPADIG